MRYEARSTAAKLNQAVKTIRAFRKRVKACEHHKEKGLKQEPNDQNGPNLDDKIEELRCAIRAAETDMAKAKARLIKLKEGGVEVDQYLDSADSLVAQVDQPEEGGSGATGRPQPEPQEWPSSNTQSQAETPQESGTTGWEEAGQGAEQEAGQEDWAAGAGWDQQQPTESAQWNGNGEAEQEAGQDWGRQASTGSGAGWAGQQSTEQQQPAVIDPAADLWRAVVLYTFNGQNSDELTVTENEEVEILVRECDEEGWLMARNSQGERGYVPTNYVEVFASAMEDPTSPAAAAPAWPATQTSSAGQVVKQVSVESTASWGLPSYPAMPSIPEAAPPVTNSSSSEEEEESEDEDGPPGKTICISFFIS